MQLANCCIPLIRELVISRLICISSLNTNRTHLLLLLHCLEQALNHPHNNALKNVKLSPPERLIFMFWHINSGV